jgi:hypothetical protein
MQKSVLLAYQGSLADISAATGQATNADWGQSRLFILEELVAVVLIVTLVEILFPFNFAVLEKLVAIFAVVIVIPSLFEKLIFSKVAFCGHLFEFINQTFLCHIGIGRVQIRRGDSRHPSDNVPSPLL